MIDRRRDVTGISRRKFMRFALCGAAGMCAAPLAAIDRSASKSLAASAGRLQKIDWGFVVDLTRCIGCGSCVRACKIENAVPDTYYRTWVERYEIDEDGEVHVDSPDGALASFKRDILTGKTAAKAFFVPKLCNHCRDSACTQVCPVGASYHSPDGVVLVDKRHCVGCGYCVQACPYGCRYISHPPGTADKCTLCYHRIHRDMPPACVDACPREARIFGDLNDGSSRIRRILRSRRYNLLKPELGTNPKCYYIGLDLEVK
jgi:Fe-S-cluster-containing dehydrogenase component